MSRLSKACSARNRVTWVPSSDLGGAEVSSVDVGRVEPEDDGEGEIQRWCIVVEMDAMTESELSLAKAAIASSISDSGVVVIPLTAHLFLGPAFPTEDEGQ